MNKLLNVWRRWGREAPVLPACVPVRTPPRLVGVGHSHLMSMLEFDYHRTALPEASASRYTFVQLLAPEHQPTLLPDGTLNPALRALIQAARETGSELAPLFACISGNEYHYIGLVDHPRPFDFVLPWRPDLALRQGAEIIPSALMRQALQRQMQGGLQILQALAAAFDGPRLVIQSPPPLPENTYIRAHPIQFADQVAQHGVAPPALRMKLWLLQSDIYRQTCEEVGLAFLPPPAEALDPGGFLLQPGWREDPVHANSWYGRQVLDQIDQVFSKPGGAA